jgi:hypothetical protein
MGVLEEMWKKNYQLLSKHEKSREHTLPAFQDQYG